MPVSADVQARIDAQKGRGRELPAAVRQEMEPAVGEDLAGARLHVGAEAHSLARGLGARAFAQGSDVFFADGAFEPHSDRGRQTLAHELAHAGQGRAAPGTVQRQAADDACATYEPGEFDQSKQEPGVLTMPVSWLKPDTLLVADFGVDWRHLKTSQTADPTLRSWLTGLLRMQPIALEVTGFSDCVGDEANNTFLRTGRARNVAALVAPAAGTAAISVAAAPRGAFVTDNTTTFNRARNRAVTVRVAGPPAPAPTPAPAMRPPEAVAELWPLLEYADKQLKRKFDAQYVTLPTPPDVAGANERIDAVIAFLMPLVLDANIKRHSRGGVQNKVFPVYWRASDFDSVRDRVYELMLTRMHVAAGTAKLDELETVTANLQFLKQRLEVLADEAVSFELDSGLVQAPPYLPSMKQAMPGSALEKPELRALAWLRQQKALIADAETKFKVDRRAIAGAIAWEASHNIMRAGLRGVGPGKMHTYDNKWGAVAPWFKDDAVPQQLEQRGYLPAVSDDQRGMMLMGAGGSITYIAASMRAASDIAQKYGYDITKDVGALTSFYQGYDLKEWEWHMIMKQGSGQTAFVAADKMAVWSVTHLAQLEAAVGAPGF